MGSVSAEVKYVLAFGDGEAENRSVEGYSPKDPEDFGFNASNWRAHVVTPFIVVGSINFDTVTTVERIPGRHEKVRAELTRDALGGAAANTASWLARLGCNVRIYGSVGNDDNGSRCLRWLNEAGVDTSHVAIDADSPTGRAFCISTTTDKRIVTSGGPKLPPIAEAIAKEVPQHGGVIHIATSETEDLINVCRAATDVGWTVSIELNGRDMSELRQLATLAFLNRDELERTFSTTPSELGPENLDSVLPRSESVLIITLGRSGALSVERTGVSTAPARRIRVVERTGAGDAFDAGFLAAYVNGCERSTCLQEGLRVAAMVLGYIGGHP
ncbi:MAG: carbohydrate kinase family protein [Acidimicrobiales bacterium]